MDNRRQLTKKAMLLGMVGVLALGVTACGTTTDSKSADKPQEAKKMSLADIENAK